MDRFSQSHRSTFSKASNLILNQDAFHKNSLGRDRQPGSGLATPGGYMSGTQYQMLKDAKVNEAISRQLRSKREEYQKQEDASSSKKGFKSRMFDHSKTLLKRKDQAQKTLERHMGEDERDERQIKAEIDYSDKRSYYAPSARQGKRSNSAGGFQLSRANVRSAFGGNNPRGERSVTQHSSKASVYSRPTTSAAISVVSASSYFSETERKNLQQPSESILEGSDEEENESGTESEGESNEEEEKESNAEKEEVYEELAKAEREEERKRLKAQRKKQRREKREAEKKQREHEKKLPSEISIPFSETYFIRNQIKTAGVQEPRKWKHGLGEKLREKDYGDDSARKDKINRRMNKEREKALVGQRLHKQNQQILSEARSQDAGLPHSQVSQLRSQRSNKPRLVPQFSKSLRIQSGIVRDEQIPDSYSIPMVSTSHSTHTERVFANHKVDKLNFKRLNMFGAYVNAAFKGGVFHGAPTDSA